MVSKKLIYETPTKVPTSRHAAHLNLRVKRTEKMIKFLSKNVFVGQCDP